MSKANVLAIAIIVLTLIICNACGVSQREPHTVEEYQVSNNEHVKEFIDPDTGVHYLVWRDGYGYGGGMSVRYNADGTIMVTE